MVAVRTGFGHSGAVEQVVPVFFLLELANGRNSSIVTPTEHEPMEVTVGREILQNMDAGQKLAEAAATELSQLSGFEYGELERTLTKFITDAKTEGGLPVEKLMTLMHHGSHSNISP